MKEIWHLLKATGEEWRDDNGNRLAASLSFFAAISIAPLLVLAVSIAGFFFSTDLARAELAMQLHRVMGPQAAAALLSVIENADRPQTATLAGIAGVIVLLWAASNVFAQLQDAMNTVWGVELQPSARLWVTARDRLLSFGIVLALGFLLAVSLVLSTVLSMLSSQLSGWLPGVTWLWQVVNELATFAAITILFALIFKLLPDAQTAWRDVWGGAVVTAILFTIGKFMLSLWLSMEGLSSAYGAAGSLVVFLLWVYFSAQIFFFGAEFTQVYARMHGDGLQPAQYAKITNTSKLDVDA